MSLTLSVGGLDGSLPQIFPFLQNLGIPSALSDLTLALSPFTSAVWPARKTVFPTTRLKGASQEGKELKPPNLKDYASKKNDYRARTKSWHRPLSQLSQDRKCPRHEEALLWEQVFTGAVWRLYLQRVTRTLDLLSSNHLNCNNMDYQEFSGATVSGQDKAFAQEFANFVNGRMCSADKTGRELTRAHRYLQQQMFKVFIGFMRQLAHNYQNGFYDERNEWASRLASEASQHLIERELIYDPEFSNTKTY